MTPDEMADRIEQDPLFLLACEAYNEARHDDPDEPESTFVWMLADGIVAVLRRLATAEVANEAAYQAGYNSGVDAQAGLDAARLATAERLRQEAEKDVDRLMPFVFHISTCAFYDFEGESDAGDHCTCGACKAAEMHANALALRAATDSEEEA